MEQKTSNNKNMFSVMKYTTVEDKTEDVILNLKIIASIQRNDKLSKNEDGILEIENNDYIQPIRRWYYNRSRSDTMGNIRVVINTAFDIIDRTLVNEQGKQESSDQKYFTEENSSLLQRFLVEMNGASKGIDNLKLTYGDDIKVVSELDCLKDQLQLRIQKINGLLTIDKNIIN